jgi:hypothetical protein
MPVSVGRAVNSYGWWSTYNSSIADIDLACAEIARYRLGKRPRLRERTRS